MEHYGASGKIENTTPSPYQPGDDLNNESHIKTKFFFSNIKFCLICAHDGELRNYSALPQNRLGCHCEERSFIGQEIASLRSQ
jgi:hypothetical protein